jgi:sirohydrochlorin ferrochelatase
MGSENSAIILLGHGSRLASGNQGLHRVAGRVAESLDGTRVEVAFLQLAEPGLEEAVERCFAAGARHVAVVPFFLFPGAHVQEDIPRALSALEARHPGLELRLAGALGEHPKLAEVAAERAREVMG